MRNFILICSFALCSLKGYCHNPFPRSNDVQGIDVEITSLSLEEIHTLDKFTAAHKKLRGNAILLAILTGPLGGHRILLGTKPIVPIIYTITLGGGFFILPLIDIISLVSTKNLDTYIDNEQVVMWIN